MVSYRWLHELDSDASHAVASLYVDAFADSLLMVAPGLRAWTEWTAGALAPNRTVVALVDGVVAAAISYSEPGRRDALTVRVIPLIRAFGLVRGVVAYRVMRYEFAGTLPAAVGRLPYIELLAVDPRFHRRGLARGIIQELVVRLDFSSYSIQVDDNNSGARALYDSVGFFEVTRVSEPWSAARKAGTMERVFMQLDVFNSPTGGPLDVEARTDSD